MDPVSLIVAALIVGATRSMEDVTENSLKDAYSRLKNTVKRFFEGRPAAQDVLEELDGSGTKPEAYKPLLEKYLQGSGAAEDEEALKAAQNLLALADPQGTRNEQYIITGGIRADRGGTAAAKMNNVTSGGYQAPPGGEPDPS